MSQYNNRIQPHNGGARVNKSLYRSKPYNTKKERVLDCSALTVDMDLWNRRIDLVLSNEELVKILIGENREEKEPERNSIIVDIGTVDHERILNTFESIPHIPAGVFIISDRRTNFRLETLKRLIQDDFVRILSEQTK